MISNFTLYFGRMLFILLHRFCGTEKKPNNMKSRVKRIPNMKSVITNIYGIS